MVPQHTSPHTAAFLVCVGLLVLIVGVHSYFRYYVMHDYPLHVFTVCDPSTHSCFVADPASADPTFQTGPYEKVVIHAAEAPNCLYEHTCSNFTCDGITASCKLSYCSPDTLEDGESCSGPSQ